MARNTHSSMEGLDEKFNYEAHLFDLELKKLATNEDRIVWTRENTGYEEYLKASDSEYTIKSARNSEMHRIEGNKYFKDKLYMKALDLYTKSMIAAPPPDERGSDGGCFSMSLCNRSAALFYLKKYKACLIDIEGALQAGYIEDRQYLLYIRKAKCLHAMELGTAAKLAIDKVVELLSKSKMEGDQQNKILKELKNHLGTCEELSDPEAKRPETVKVSMPTLPHGRNASHPSLSSSCKVVYDTDKGHHVVATRDIRPGEVILVEEPYSCLLTKGGYDIYCHHCCGKLSIAPIACQHCTKVLFCSPGCMDHAWNAYHRYECSMGTRLSINKHYLALRIGLVAGLDELLKYGGESPPPARTTFDMAECNEQGHYRSSDFNTINHLVKHADKLSTRQMFLIAGNAAAYTKSLEEVNFFQSIPAGEKESAILCVGQCLMSIIQAIQINAASIEEPDAMAKIPTTKGIGIGIGMYPTCALFSHSCADNSLLVRYANNLVIHARRTIKKGEEVAISYGVRYLCSPREERRSVLQEEGYFKCSCEACVNNWPLFSHEACEPVLFKCENCQHPLCPNTGGNSYAAQCPSCKQWQDIPSIEAFDQDLLMRYQHVEGHLSVRKFNEALIVLQKEIEKLENMVVFSGIQPLWWTLELERCCIQMGHMYTEGP